MADVRTIASLDPYELWKILSQLQPNAYEFVPGAQKFGVRERGRNMVRYFRTVDELENFVKTARRNPCRPAEPAGHEETPEPPPSPAVEHRELAEARAQIRRLEEINVELRDKGKQVVADRDRWEAKANSLERELARTRVAQRQARAQPAFGQKGGGDGNANAKIKTAKIAFAKLCHPNNQRSSGSDATIRAEIFKEFWEQLERIESER